MAKTQLTIFTEASTLKTFEVVSDKVSKQYVPIFTSTIVDTLAPEFTFVEGIRYFNFNTMHSVLLRNDENDLISIDNSYDRSRAFSFRLISDGIAIPLDLDRQVHKGENARNLIKDFIVDKEELLEAIENAKDLVRSLQEVNARPEFKKEILDMVFEGVYKRKGFVELDMIVGDSYDTVWKYIVTVVDRFLKGEYNVVITNKAGNETIRKGRVVKSRFQRLEITNKIVKLLEEEYVEMFV